MFDKLVNALTKKNRKAVLLWVIVSVVLYGTGFSIGVGALHLLERAAEQSSQK